MTHTIITFLLKTVYIFLEDEILLSFVEESHVVGIGLAFVETAFSGATAIVVDVVLFEVSGVHVGLGLHFPEMF